MSCVVWWCKLGGDGKLTNPFDALCSPGREPFLLDVINLLLSNLSVRVLDCKDSGREAAVESLLGMCYTCTYKGTSEARPAAAQLIASPSTPARTGNSGVVAGVGNGKTDQDKVFTDLSAPYMSRSIEKFCSLDIFPPLWV